MNKIREEAIFPEQSRDYTTRITFSTKRDVARVLKHALHSRLAHGPANSFRIKVLGTNELEVNMREGQITEVLEGMRSTLVNKYQIKSWTVEEEVEEVKTQDAEENTTKELSLGSDLSIHVQDLALELGLYKDEVAERTTEAERLKSEAAILQRKMSEYKTGKKGYETKLEQNKQLLRLQEEQLGVLSVENSRLVSERVPIQVLEAAKNERDYLQTQVQQLEKKVASSTEQLKRVQDDFIKRQADAYREWEITRTTDFNRIKNLEEKIAKDNKRIPAVEVTAADEIVNRELEQLKNKLPKQFTYAVTVTRPAEEQPWQGPIGRISREFIEKYVKQPEKKLFFLCGSEAFVNSVIDILKTLKVPPASIRNERWGI